MKRLMLSSAALLVFLTAGLFGEPKVESLLGAGATFPYPLYSKMFEEYYNITKIKVNYQAIGSGGGIQQLISKTVDFGGSDAPMNNNEKKAAKYDVIHIPTCLGAVVLTYSLPGNPTINLTPEVIADIFLGKITKWNDPKIVEINKETALPDLAITVVHRSDGSGTTYTFSDYLSAVSPDWKASVGTGKSLNWPVGIGGKGNPGVTAYIKQIPGGVGYVEQAYAVQNNMPMARLKNKSGNFITPDLKSVMNAANVDIPADAQVSLVNTAAPDGYPICTFTWIILYKEQSYGGRPLNRSQEAVKLIWWMVHEGQQYNEALLYGRLPEKVVKIDEDLLNSVVYNGKKIAQ
jgi:phosphate transport system substrate-binding protein